MKLHGEFQINFLNQNEKKSEKPSWDGMTDRRTAMKTLDKFTLKKRYVPWQASFGKTS